MEIKFNSNSNNNNFDNLDGDLPKRKFSVFFKIIIITVIILITLSIYFVYKNNKSDQTSLLSHDTQKLIKEIGEHIILPQGEEPTVATVSDPEKIKNQPFFANSKEGDKLLVYLVARKAFLYRPSEKKLVEVAPLSAENTGSIGNE